MNIFVYICRMKKIILLVTLLLAGVLAHAQSYKLVLSPEIPADAAQVLTQRFTQMLEGGGLKVADEGTPLEVKAADVSVMVVNPASNQVVLEVILLARAGEASQTFNIKGVGEGEADAWLRAVKRLLPRSESAAQFVEKLK